MWVTREDCLRSMIHRVAAAPAHDTETTRCTKTVASLRLITTALTLAVLACPARAEDRTGPTRRPGPAA